LTFSINISTYLLQPTTTIPPVQRMWKNFCQSLNTTEYRERTARLTSTRALTPLTCELWQDQCSITFSDLWSHHCEECKQLLSPFLFVTYNNYRKNSFQII
jgi:hypothetical protein